MVLTVTLNPAIDKTVVIPDFTAGRVNRIAQMRQDPGGKGINVAKAVKALGGSSLALGILGGSTGEYIKKCLDRMRIANDFVFVREQTRTNIKIIDPERKTNTDINEPGEPASDETLQEVFNKIESHVSAGDTVVLAGKAPQGADDGIFAQWISLLHRMGVAAYLDADGASLSAGVKAFPDLIKPNEEEFARLSGRSFGSREDIAFEARRYVAGGIGKVVVSLGEKGALFVTADRTAYAYGLDVPVRSTVGAGDTMMAVLALGNDMGYSWEETIRLSVAAGAASVMCEGTEAVSIDIVKELREKVRIEG